MITLPNNIVCFSTVSFDHPTWTNKQQLMSRLSKTKNVFYIEDPVLLNEFYHQNRHLKPIEKRHKNLTIIRPWKLLPFGAKNSFINEINWKVLSYKFKNILPVDSFFWIYDPAAFPALKLLTHEGSLYDCVDDYSQFPNSFYRQELDLIQKVDFFTVSDSFLQKKFMNVRMANLVENRGDLLENFESLPKEFEKIKQLQGPKFLFAGAINFKLDLEKIYNNAKNNPHIQFIFVGTKHLELPNLSNIHIFPPLSNKSLGSLYSLMDMCYIPYKKPLDGVNPLKVYEALSLGIPVYGTILESLDKVSHLLFDDSKISFSEALEKSTKDFREQLKTEHQKLHLRWQDRLEDILKVINHA